MTDNLSRREFIKSALGTASALSAPTIISYLGKSATSSDKEFLEIRDGSFYIGGEEFTIKGANYQTRDYPWRMFKEYDPEQIGKELRYAEELGINTIRVPIMHPYSIGKTKKDWKSYDYLDIKEEYFNNFEDFLSTADDHQIKVMPILLGYTPHPWFEPKNHEFGKKYLEKWLPEFKEDERILAWDVKNEPDIHEELMREKHGNKYDIEGFTKSTAKALRDLDSKHPITIGLSDTYGVAESEDNLVDELSSYIDHEDFYSFHFYIPIKYFDRVVEQIQSKTRKPILLQEFGLPTLGDKHHTEGKQKWYFEEVLERINREDLNGSIFWKLNDHPKEISELENPWGHVYANSSKKERARKFGVLRTDYSKKPAAHVVQQYYKWIL
ncbi:cellulase family glycosylhydrolase [Candidatus Bipolaricaulota bacterium]|nr:cellulase family glycosylhydrolase [Candidatus Bipolaricaulota bacterium]